METETGNQVKTEAECVEAHCVICADDIIVAPDTLTDLPNEEVTEREVDWTKFLSSFLSVKCDFPLTDIYGCRNGGSLENVLLQFCIPCRQVCLQVVDINVQIQQLMQILESVKRDLKMKVRNSLSSESKPDSPFARLLRDLIVDTSVVLTPITAETQLEGLNTDNGFLEIGCCDSDSEWNQHAEIIEEDYEATEALTPHPQDCLESVLAQDDGFQHLEDSVAFSGADSKSKRRSTKKRKVSTTNMPSKTAASSFSPDQVISSKPFPAVPKGQTEYMGVVVHLGDRYNAKYQDSRCSLCGFVFSRKDSCFKHIKTVHIDENGVVKNNVRMSTKKVKCGVCGSLFARPSNCKDHINKFHGVGDVIHLVMNAPMPQQNADNKYMQSENSRSPEVTDERVDTEENHEILPTPSAGIVESGHEQEENPHVDAEVLSTRRSVRNINRRMPLKSKASTKARSKSTASSFFARRRLRTRSLPTALTGRTVFMGAPMYIGDKYGKNFRYTKCGLCGFVFTRRHHCQSHIKSVHIGQNGEVLKTLPKNFRKSFKCDICGYLFATRKGCKLHGQSFHNGTAKVIQIPMNSKRAQLERRYLKTEEPSVTNNIGSDNDFAMDNDNIAEEIQLADSSVGNILGGNAKCETSQMDSQVTDCASDCVHGDPDVNESKEATTCDSSRYIKEAEQAQKHILTVPTSRQMYMGVEIHVADTGNDGNRPTKCGVCQYVFTRRDHCKKHIKNVHIGEDGKVRMNIKIVHKRVKCGVCGILFSDKKTCQNHIRRFHNGDGNVIPLENVKKVATLSNNVALDVDERTLVNCTNEVTTEDAKMKSVEPNKESTEDGVVFVVTPSTSQTQTRRSNRVDYKKLIEQDLLSEDEDADNLGEESNDDDYEPKYIGESGGSVDEGKLTSQIDQIASSEKRKRKKPSLENCTFHTSEDGRFWFKHVEIIRTTTEFGITEYLCSICAKENLRHHPFKIKYKIRDHVLKVHLNPKKTCATKVYPDGRVTFKDVEILKSQDPYGFDGYNCGLCQNTVWFDTRVNVIRHIRRCHDGPGKNKSVPVSSVGMRRFKRRKTGRLFFKQFEFKKVGPTTYSCCTCDDLKIYSAPKILKHIRLAHVGPDETWHKCHLCEKEFSTKRFLEDHLEFHSTERKYICDICGKSFKFRSNLNGHQKTHDESKRIFGCNFCEKRFLHLRDQRVHERSHTKEKPFMCEMCPATFKVMHLLNKHLKTEHQDTATT